MNDLVAAGDDEADAPATSVAKAAPTAPGPGPVERLAGPAFPEWTPRGLPGGSLSLSMHGMPWPYTPRTGLGISGYVWSDGGYESISRGNATEANIKYLVNQVRGVVNRQYWAAHI